MNHISKTFFTGLKLLQLRKHTKDTVYLEVAWIPCVHLRGKREIRSFRLKVSTIVNRILLCFRHCTRLFLQIDLKMWACVREGEMNLNALLDAH